MARPLWLLVLLASCGVNPAVLYRCDEREPRCQSGAECWADGYCHPSGADRDAGLDGGVRPDSGPPPDLDGGTDAGPGDGGCVPTPLAQACAGIECGFVNGGCGVELDCGAWCAPGLECGVSSPNVCGTPSVCMPTGWCWEHPLPLGMSYQAIAALSPRLVWLAGEDGVAFFDGEKTSLPDLGLTAPTTLEGVAAGSASDVSAVGPRGAIIHFDGQQWSPEGAGGPVTADLHAVVSLGEGAAVAVGDNGRAFFRFADAGGASASQRWVPAASTGTSADLVGLAASDAGLFALGRTGQLLQRTGVLTFAVIGAIPLGAESARALVHRGGRLYAAVGTRLVRLDGTGWTTLDAGAAYRVMAFAIDGDSLWAAGPQALVRLDAQDVAGPNLDTPGLAFQAIATLRPGELLAGGTGGALAVVSDGGLLLRSTGSTTALTTLCGSGPSSLFTGGVAGACAPGQCRPEVLLRAPSGSGATWSPVAGDALGNSTALNGCYAFDPSHTLLMGTDSMFYRWNGSRMVANAFDNMVKGAYLGAWGQPDAGYFFAREAKNVLTFGDAALATFSKLDVGVGGTSVSSVWGVTSADWVGAVGDQGLLAERDHNHAWSAHPFGSAHASMRALHASRASDGGYFFVAAGQGVAWTRAADGGTFEDALPGNPALLAAWSSTTQTVWVAGNDSANRALVARRNPGSASWAPVTLVTGRSLTALFGLDGAGQSLWLAGDGGMILRLDTR